MGSTSFLNKIEIYLVDLEKGPTAGYSKLKLERTLIGKYMQHKEWQISFDFGALL